jgi:hypothetical protein
MELSPSWEAVICAATQELPSNLWNPKFHHRVHKGPPMVPVLSQIDPVHTIPSYLRSILILSTHVRLGFRYFFPHYAQRTCPIHTSNVPSTKTHIQFLTLKSIIQGICPGPRFLMNFRNKVIFYGELLAPRQTPKLEDHPLSAVRDCLFNIFAATLYIWRLSPPSATWRRAMPWWQRTHLQLINL